MTETKSSVSKFIRQSAEDVHKKNLKLKSYNVNARQVFSNVKYHEKRVT